MKDKCAGEKLKAVAFKEWTEFSNSYKQTQGLHLNSSLN